MGHRGPSAAACSTSQSGLCADVSGSRRGVLRGLRLRSSTFPPKPQLTYGSLVQPGTGGARPQNTTLTTACLLQAKRPNRDDTHSRYRGCCLLAILRNLTTSASLLMADCAQRPLGIT